MFDYLKYLKFVYWRCTDDVATEIRHGRITRNAGIELVNKYLASINKKKFIIDKNTCSIHFEKLISKYNKILKFNDPIYKFKAIKSKQEIESIKKTHIYDGVALTKYLFWVKNNFFKKTITEISASQKLLQLREWQEHQRILAKY